MHYGILNEQLKITSVGEFMERDYKLVFFSFVIATLTLRGFFLLIDESGYGWSLSSLVRSFVELACYSATFYFFSRVFSESRFYSIASSLAVGSLIFYLFTTGFGLYKDWDFISSNWNDLYERHVSMVFSAQLFIRLVYVFIFLGSFFVLRIPFQISEMLSSKKI